MTNVGVATETKVDEYRVALTPAGVRELTARKHTVLVQTGAGLGCAIQDQEYVAQGAEIVPDAAAVFRAAELIVKVKEPQAAELALLRPEHVLLTFLHLAADEQLTHELMRTGATCIAYETIADAQGRLPLLAPMSEVAGKLAGQAGAVTLETPFGGPGLLLGGVTGVPASRVMVIGGGIVGQNAAEIALGLGADVAIFDLSIDRLRQLEVRLKGRASTCFASRLEIEEWLPQADLVIGAVLVRGAKAPRVITREHLELMKPEAVLVDVSIDQGGCFETSIPTSHSEPTYKVDGVTHYCVTNMPGAVPVTATRALTNATLPYIIQLADYGLAALADDPGFLAGLNVAGGRVTCGPVAEEFGLEAASPAPLVASRPDRR